MIGIPEGVNGCPHECDVFCIVWKKYCSRFMSTSRILIKWQSKAEKYFADQRAREISLRFGAGVHASRRDTTLHVSQRPQIEIGAHTHTRQLILHRIRWELNPLNARPNKTKTKGSPQRSIHWKFSVRKWESRNIRWCGFWLGRMPLTEKSESAGTSLSVPSDILRSYEELRWMEPHMSSPSPCGYK